MADQLERDGPGAAWCLSFDEHAFLERKPEGQRLAYAVQLKFFQSHGFFAEPTTTGLDAMAADFAEQLGLPVDPARERVVDLPAIGRTARRQRAEILAHLGVRRFAAEDRVALSAWLAATLPESGDSVAQATDKAFLWLRDRGVHMGSRREVARLVGTERRKAINAMLEQVVDALPPATITKLDASLADTEGETGFAGLKAEPGRIALTSLLNVSNRLAFLRSLDLPHEHLAVIGAPWLASIRRRVSRENGWEMRRHPRLRRLGLYALYLHARESELVDGLADLLIDTVHKIAVKAERTVAAAIAAEVETIGAKEVLLARLASAALADPDAPVRTVIFPVAGQTKLEAIVREHEAKGTWTAQVFATMRASFARHYRPMVPALLGVLRFRAEAAADQPLLTALAQLRRLDGTTARMLKTTDAAPDGVPVEGVIPAKWRTQVIDETGRINRIDYELCVLLSLRERLRCRAFWIEGADRFRDPDQDLPQDFADRRSAYYADLGLSEDAKAFTADIRTEMERQLQALDRGVPRNSALQIRWSGRHRIGLSPLDPQPEATGLTALKGEIERRWPMTGLMDVLTECALDTGFLDVFQTSGERVLLSREALQRRLLLCLYGLGANTGLRRVSAAVDDASYKELLHVRRRFIEAPSLREA
ncbi:MAG: DUF4158 domain-containing protein, partial [Pseudomonadota bacterium]